MLQPFLSNRRAHFTCVASLYFSMGKDFRKKDRKEDPKETKVKKDEAKDAKKKVGGIPKYQFLQKACLAAYPDEEGNALWLGDKESVKELLKPDSVMNRCTNKNSEMLARPGMALSLAASALQHGGNVLVSGKGKKAIEKAMAIFKDKDAEAFLKAAKVLNLGKSGTASRSDVKTAVHTYVKFMVKHQDGLHDAVVGLVSSCSLLYLFGMHMVEQGAFFEKSGSWAKKWKRFGSEPVQMKAWIKDPGSQSKLEEALVDLVMEKSDAHKKRARAEESSKSKASSPATSSASSRKASSSRGRSRSSNRKSKKGRKESKDKDNKKDKKEKKEKSPKKERKKRRSSSRSCSGTGSKANKRSKSPSPAASKKGRVKQMELSSDDQEASSPEAVPTEEALGGWNAEEAAKLQEEVAAGLESLTDKKKRLGLSALVGLLDNLPAEVLEFAGLSKMLPKLKVMTKLPKAESVQQILLLLQEVCLKKAAGSAAEPLAKHVMVTIHRIGGVARDGKAVVREGDPVDTVEVAASGTVEDALAAFFEAQGSSEDRCNWQVKALTDDFKLLQVYPETMPVTTCSQVALVRKGG